MNETYTDLKNKLRGRFGDREDIGKEGFYARYYSATDLSKEALLELLELIEFEYELSPGLLRPEDKLSKLVDPISTKNPWSWLVYHAAAGDRQSELSYRLDKRMRQYGTLGTWRQIETVNDLVSAWCGHRPS